jgi:hypothetical protein
MKESEKKGKNYQKDYLKRKRASGACWWSGCHEIPDEGLTYCLKHRQRLSIYQKGRLLRINEQARLWREHERAVHNNGIIERVK